MTSSASRPRPPERSRVRTWISRWKSPSREIERVVVRVQNGEQRPGILASPEARIKRLRRNLRLKSRKGLVVFNGGTGELPADAGQRLQKVLRDGLVRVADEDGLTLLTGGTDAGVFRILGRALDSRGRNGRVIGVAPSKLVAWQRPAADSETAAGDGSSGAVPLEPHHTDFVLVEAGAWGGETGVMLGLAGEIARAQPSVAVLAGGGDGARREMLAHVRQKRPIIVLRGTGRLADDLARAHESGGHPTDSELNEISRRGLVTVVDLHEPADVLAAEVRLQLAAAWRARRRRQRPAVVRRLPQMRWRLRNSYQQLVEFEERAPYPELNEDFVFLDDHLMPAYRECDTEALRQQNGFYRANMIYLVGSFAATVLGIVQAAVGGGLFWIGLLESVLAAALGGGIVVATLRTNQRGYYTNRLKAERLRSEYFLFLGRQGHYADPHSRRDALQARVQAIRTMSGTPR